MLYALPEGPELLDVRTPKGPDGTYTWGVDTFRHLPQEAQDNISAYYQQQGLMYDTQEELERAYQEYRQWEHSSPFPTQIVRQEITPTASAPNLIYFTTTVDRYIDGGVLSTEARCGAFYKDTGEPIALEDLFLCAPDTLIQTILDNSLITDSTQKQEMMEAFRLESLTFQRESLAIYYPDGSLSSEDAACSYSFAYDDAVTWLMQPWAVPETA